MCYLKYFWQKIPNLCGFWNPSSYHPGFWTNENRCSPSLPYYCVATHTDTYSCVDFESKTYTLNNSLNFQRSYFNLIIFYCRALNLEQYFYIISLWITANFLLATALTASKIRIVSRSTKNLQSTHTFAIWFSLPQKLHTIPNNFHWFLIWLWPPQKKYSVFSLWSVDCWCCLMLLVGWALHCKWTPLPLVTPCSCHCQRLSKPPHFSQPLLPRRLFWLDPNMTNLSLY